MLKKHEETAGLRDLTISLDRHNLICMVGSSANFEVELKAGIRNPGEVEKRIKKIAKHVETYTTEDTYFTYASRKGYQDERFRLRLMKGKAVVTAKERKSARGVEANLEYEFEVDNAQAFRDFLRLFGFRVLIEKTKRVKKFRYVSSGKKKKDWRVSIELNHVRGLGHFVEIEALVRDAGDVSEARLLILEILDRLGIPRSRIELTPYTRMLYDRKHKKTGR